MEISRAELMILKNKGWKFRDAGLYQQPGYPQENKWWRMLRLGNINNVGDRPIILIPPDKEV